MKETEAKCSFDKIGMADFSIAAAFTAIQWAQGPNMLHEYTYGR